MAFPSNLQTPKRPPVVILLTFSAQLLDLRPYRLDEYGLCYSVLTRPSYNGASYQVSVRQLALLIHTSFRPSLTATPLSQILRSLGEVECFSNPSPPSGWIGDFHSLVNMHVRHTRLKLAGRFLAPQN